MKCSKCDEEACYIKYYYKNDKSIDYVEGRCEEHFIETYKNPRQNRKDKIKLKQGKSIKRKKQAEIKDVKTKKGFWSWLLH